MRKNRKRLRFAELRRDGWELLNVRELKADCEKGGCPFPLLLPDSRKLENLRAGQKVKLVFDMPTSGLQLAWVEMGGRLDGFYFGKVSEPVPRCLRKVMEVVFTGDYALEVW